MVAMLSLLMSLLLCLRELGAGSFVVSSPSCRAQIGRGNRGLSREKGLGGNRPPPSARPDYALRLLTGTSAEVTRSEAQCRDFWVIYWVIGARHS